MPAAWAELVYERLRAVPRGRVTTYGALARAAGRPLAARAVGRIMNQNPYAPAVPCHRVIMANGQLGGFAGGSEKKARLLRREGVKIADGKISDFKKIFFIFGR